MADDGRIKTFRPRPIGKPFRTKARARRLYDERAGRAEDWAFYNGKPWQDVRAFKLGQDPLCEPCLALGVTTLATQVHHVKERKACPELALDVGNLESCCLPCHNSKRSRDGKRQA